MTRPVLQAALAAGFADVEDAVPHEAARGSFAGAIVTRDRTGFRPATLPALSPDELLDLLGALARKTRPWKNRDRIQNKSNHI